MTTSTTEAPGSERPNTLAITAAVLGGLGAVCALSVVWFFVAVPLGIAAIACALVDRRHRRNADEPTSGISTVGLVLGVAVLPMALGAFLVIPRVEHVAERAARALQGGVQADLHSLERTTNHNVDSLDSTLTELVNETDRTLSRDAQELERSTSEDLASLEQQLNSSLEEFDRTTTKELEELETSLRRDVELEDNRAASVQTDLRADVDALIAEINELRQLYEAQRSEK